MTIFVDIDGCLADFHTAVLDKWNEEHQTSFTIEDWDDWHGTKISNGDVSWWKYTAEPGFWKNLAVLPDAQWLVQAVKNSGLPWAFLTTIYPDKSPYAATERYEWIEGAFGKEAKEHLLVSMGDTKAHVVRKGDILIDDCAKYIKEAQEAGAAAFCLRKPWNKEIPMCFETMQLLIQSLEKYIWDSLYEPMTYSDLGRDIGKLVEEKQKAYGDSFSRANQLFEILYPDGIKVEEYKKVLLLARIFDKVFRAVTAPDAFGESPFEDIAGYSLLEAMRHREAKKKEKK